MTPDPFRALIGADISRFLGWVVCNPVHEMWREEPERADRIRAAIQRWGSKPLSAEVKTYLNEQRPEWEQARLAG